ncbi:MAG: hypothetical protein ACRENA_04170 [Vulcanimicrobiaceae bacterium]
MKVSPQYAHLYAGDPATIVLGDGARITCRIADDQRFTNAVAYMASTGPDAEVEKYAQNDAIAYIDVLGSRHVGDRTDSAAL